MLKVSVSMCMLCLEPCILPASADHCRQPSRQISRQTRLCQGLQHLAPCGLMPPKQILCETLHSPLQSAGLRPCIQAELARSGQALISSADLWLCLLRVQQSRA